MKNLLLVRVSYDDDGTYGILIRDDKFPWLMILEQGQRGNMANVSAIPPGRYLFKKTATPQHGLVFMGQNIPGRSAILVHPGNTELDTRGCLLPGKRFGKLEAKDLQSEAVEMQTAVLDSKEAFAEFMEYMKDDSAFMLDIVNAWTLTGKGGGIA